MIKTKKKNLQRDTGCYKLTQTGNMINLFNQDSMHILTKSAMYNKINITFLKSGNPW